MSKHVNLYMSGEDRVCVWCQAHSRCSRPVYSVPLCSLQLLYLSTPECWCLFSVPVPGIPPSQLATSGVSYAWLEVSQKQGPHALHEKCYEVAPALDQEPGDLNSSLVSLSPSEPQFSHVLNVGGREVTRWSLESFWTMYSMVFRSLTQTGSSLKTGELWLLLPLDPPAPLPVAGRGLCTFMEWLSKPRVVLPSWERHKTALPQGSYPLDSLRKVRRESTEVP